MERHRDQDFEKIRQSLLRMGGLVERMISEAMAALVERDTSRAQAVIRTDSEVDRLRHTAQQKLKRDEYAPRMLRGQPRGLRG